VAAAAALEEALKPPFSGEMRARLAAEPDKALAWQIEAVIGDGIVGLDLVGRAEAADRPAEPAAPAVAAEPAGDGAASAPPAADDARLAAIREQLQTLAPGDQAGLMALARTVADAAGWRLPPSGSS
jgi:hypothetical protein